MKNIIEAINQILAEWDPLDVGGGISLDEYQRYVPLIIKHIERKEHLILCLENILDSLEVEYDKNNEKDKRILRDVAEKIIKLKNQN